MRRHGFNNGFASRAVCDRRSPRGCVGWFPYLPAREAPLAYVIFRRHAMKFREYTYLGATQSFCPECLPMGSVGARNLKPERETANAPAVRLVPAKIIERGGRVYFRKFCPTHGLREDFVCSDVKWYDRNEF